MPTSRHRLLWTGPSPSAMLDHLLAQEAIDPNTIWLVPSPLCRQRVLRRLTLRSGSLRNPRVWTWDDLWAEIRSNGPRNGPAMLSDVATREFLRAAIDEALSEGSLQGLGPLTKTAGYRRLLLGQFSVWSRQSRELASAPPGKVDPALWSIYGHYRRLLDQRHAADRPLFEAWAARIVSTVWNAIAGASTVKVIAPPTGALERQALKAIIQRSESVHILMPWEDDPDRSEVYADLVRMRNGCHAFGFEVVEHALSIEGPEGVRAIQQTLFRDPEPPLTDRTEGLTLLGSPQGDGSAVRIARTVRNKLDAGAAPDEILILFARWTELADRTIETLVEAGIPAWSSRKRPQANDPTISVLRLLLDLPVNGWESASLASVLRLGTIALEGFDRSELVSAAAAIRGLRVFRGLDAIRARLQSEAILDPDDKDLRKRAKAARADSAIRVLEALATIYEGLEPAETWDRRIHDLRRVLARYSLASRALDQLLASLQELGETRRWLGQGDETLTWSAFSREVLALAREMTVEPPPQPPGAVRLALVSEAAGALARHVLLAGLEEGSFPDAEVLEPETPGVEAVEGEASPAECAYAREMRRFLSVLDIPSESLTLAYPTTDEKGVSLLPCRLPGRRATVPHRRVEGGMRRSSAPARPDSSERAGHVGRRAESSRGWRRLPGLGEGRVGHAPRSGPNATASRRFARHGKGATGRRGETSTTAIRTVRGRPAILSSAAGNRARVRSRPPRRLQCQPTGDPGKLPVSVLSSTCAQDRTN